MLQTWEYANVEVLPLLLMRYKQILGKTDKPPKEGPPSPVEVMPGYGDGGPCYKTQFGVWTVDLVITEIVEEWNRVYSDEYQQTLKVHDVTYRIVTDDDGDVVDVVYSFQMFE